MARKRMIHPSIWTDEGMGELTMRQQLLYIGLFSNADDDGRLKYSAAGLRLMLPTLYQGVTLEDIEHDLGCVLSAMTKTVRYEVDGRAYLAFVNYRSWQIIQRPTASVLPPPPGAALNEDSAQPDDAGVSAQGAVAEDSAQPDTTGVSTQRALNEDSMRTQSQLSLGESRGDQERSGEGDPGAAAPPAPRKPRSSRPKGEETRIPDDFPLTGEMRRWAAEQFPDLDVERAHLEFCTFWRGDGRRKANWRATWENGMVKADERRRERPQPRASPARANGKLNGDDAADEAIRLLRGGKTGADPADLAIEANYSVRRT